MSGLGDKMTREEQTRAAAMGLAIQAFGAAMAPKGWTLSRDEVDHMVDVTTRVADEILAWLQRRPNEPAASVTPEALDAP